MKILSNAELKSFIRGFSLFFISLVFLVLLLHKNTYEEKIHSFNDSLYAQMKIASLEQKSVIFNIDFVKKSKDKQLYNILSDDKLLFVFFKISNSKNYIKISYSIKNYDNDIKIIKNEIIDKAVLNIKFIFILSLIFSIYTIYPLKQSLYMTHEFIKDILHDFNTPISTIRLNIDLLKDSDTKVTKRIKNSIETILNLQNNLKSYIDDTVGKSTKFNIKELIENRIELIKSNYPNIKFTVQIDNIILYGYQDGMVRILDNILSNSCKYNKNDGEVTISFNKNILQIKDTGIGIKNPTKIFDRFYKETTRGLGIGLHIVKKLSKNMNISLNVKSRIDKGTTFELDLTQLILP